MAIAEKTLDAESGQLGNDLYWKVWDREDGFVRWIGYDDSFWWDTIAKSDRFMTRVGPVSGRTYRLDPNTDTVTVASA